MSINYRPDIDGMRAFAVLSVVVFHYFSGAAPGGFIGVDVFFVISGFLITSILLAEQQTRFTVFNFYVRRIIRIFPSLIVVMGACIIVGSFALFPTEYEQLGKHLASAAIFIANFVFEGERGYFDKEAVTKPFLHLWSLSIEEQFYLFWPLIISLYLKLPFRNAPLVLLAFFFALFMLAVGLNTTSNQLFYLPHLRFWELLAGAFLAHSIKPMKAPKQVVDFLSIIGFALLIFSVSAFDAAKHAPSTWVIAPVIGAYLLIFAGPNAVINSKLLSNPIAVWLGKISFPFYLWHWPILAFATIIQSQTPSKPTRISLLIAALLLAQLTYLLVEKPIKNHPAKNIFAVALLSLMVVAGSLGLTINLLDGLPSRTSLVGYVDNSAQTQRTDPTDQACLNTIQDAQPPFYYCRLSDVDSRETIALIGDSHAHAAFIGMAEMLKAKNIKVLLLANTGCPILVNTPIAMDEPSRRKCNESMAAIFKILAARPDVKKVVMLSRGPIYLKGNFNLSGNSNLLQASQISSEQFKLSLQATIDLLRSMGKDVFYVSENPELPWTAASCVSRPWRSANQNCTQPLSTVVERQSDYLKILAALTSVHIINALEIFCANNKCDALSSGDLLYADDNHLSIKGSYLQAKAVVTKLFEQ